MAITLTGSGLRFIVLRQETEKPMKRIIEVRAAAGGEMHAYLLDDLVNAYIRLVLCL